MATVTAQILIGKSHLYQEGINPTHQIFLYENSRPLLTLSELSNGGTPASQHVTTWIPTVETMANDILLMAAVCILGHQESRAVLLKTYPDGIQNIDTLYSVPENDREHLYRMSRKALADSDMKLVVTILNGSTLINQVSKLLSCKLDLELCKAKSA